MTTISPANFSFKDANGNLGNVLTLTASDILLLNTALQDVEDLKSAIALGLAKTDFSNINDTAKIAIAHNAMPSDKYDDLTLGTSGTIYTAPADGFIVFARGATAMGQYITIIGPYLRIDSSSASSNAYGLRVFLPIKKGDSFRIDYNASGAIAMFRFVYAVGSESEQ